MVLHKSNFDIPARLTFQPYSAEWRFAMAETAEWATEPGRLMRAFQPNDVLEKNSVKVRIEIPDSDAPPMLAGYGLGIYPTYTEVLDRASIPPSVLQAHENHGNTLDISGRNFRVLICQKREFEDGHWTPNPEKVTKNAWIMRNEFLELDADRALGWEWSVQQFLNKWGFWGFGQFLVKGFDMTSHSQLGTLFRLVKQLRTDKPGFVMVIPHLLKEHQERYRKALLPANARQWLRSHPPQLDLLETSDNFPLFRLRRRYCTDAIDATITIDHLAKRRFGICKRCHTVFQRETKHKKNYCSERCFNAAGVQRWRENQKKKSTKKGA